MPSAPALTGLRPWRPGDTCGRSETLERAAARRARDEEDTSCHLQDGRDGNAGRTAVTQRRGQAEDRVTRGAGDRPLAQDVKCR